MNYIEFVQKSEPWCILCLSMLRYLLYLFPVFLLLGAGCVIGNSVNTDDGIDLTAGAGSDFAGGTILAGSEGAGDFNDTPGGEELPPFEGDEPEEGDEDLYIEGEARGEVEAGLDVLPGMQVVDMKSGNFFFDPPLISAQPGELIEVRISENRGLHTFVIDELGINQQLTNGTTFQFVAPQTAGDYSFYCDIGDHRALGMEGILRIE